MKTRIGLILCMLCILTSLFSCQKRTESFHNGTYCGMWHDGKPQGYGRYESSSDSLSYEGNWVAGAFDGYGCCRHKDTLYYGYFRAGCRQGEGTMVYPDGATYKGEWDRNHRSGYGELTDSCGRRIKGEWRLDTLASGVVKDSMGIYRGTLGRILQPEGVGEYTTPDGHYYSGHWHDGLQEGFGFAVAPNEVVKCGIWRRGRFQGEQMLYNAQRIYGIDISKYQHRIGRRVYPIDWSDLRITHLGHISKKKVQGTVDYPVSFVYIKATEGLTVFNPYYTKDRNDARRHGYHVGAYHFFTTRPASGQAAYFLRRAAVRKGDLPPMLDMELSDSKIEAMGGIDVLFSEMLVWLKIVGERCGTTPVLYLNQQFVNKYMASAPEALKAYPVWIARYGEYKPYVHLQYWQLSPDGRVKGIHGDVDINVYNGSPEHFEDYVKNAVVK